MKRLLCVSVLIAILSLSAIGGAQENPRGINIPPEVLEQMRADQEAYRSMPDMPGTGPFPATKEEDPGLPDHVVYRPADLSKVGAGSLPIVAWGNGGCSGDGASGRLHLLEIASHGYLVIANGTIKSGPGTTPPAPREMGRPGEGFTPPPPQSSAAQMTEAMDWAMAENSRSGSPYYGKINTDAVAVSGYSCGGIQALTIATTDARVDTAVIHNSGIHPESNQPRMPGMELRKDALVKLHTPVIYVLGGPTDIAFKNGMDDFDRISHVPVVVADIEEAGHGGTFNKPNGGKAAQVAVAWLDWQLKGDDSAAKWFIGPDWEIKSKNF